jgi:hypothetical protein
MSEHNIIPRASYCGECAECGLPAKEAEGLWKLSGPHHYWHLCFDCLAHAATEHLWEYGIDGTPKDEKIKHEEAT